MDKKIAIPSPGGAVAAGCESTDIATDKALAGEVISCSGSVIPRKRKPIDWWDASGRK